MKALLVEKLPEGDFIYGVKLDGYRALSFKDGKKVRLVSRNNKPLNYTQLQDALKLLPVDHVILDGEIVALDGEGRSSFQLLQVFKSSQKRVKLKLTRAQEFVIGGYTLPEGNRKYFGSLLVGYNSPEGLRFAGRVGTGFSEKLLASIDAQLQKLKRSTCPFINLPEKTKSRWGLGITPAVMKRCQWVKPVLVAQVKFTEWTLDDQLRQPVFLGLRTDKEAPGVVRE